MLSTTTNAEHSKYYSRFYNLFQVKNEGSAYIPALKERGFGTEELIK